MRLDLAIVNGTLVDEHGSRAADIGIAGERIVLQAAPGTLPQAEQTIDARGLLVLPGLIDAHFHIRGPDRPDREDVYSGMAGAAAGGTTALFEMPIADVGTSHAELLLGRQALFEQDALIDFGLFGACGSLDAATVNGLAKAGAIGFKIFTLNPPPARRAAFNGINITAEADILRALELVRQTGLTCAIHAENGALLDLYHERARAAGNTDIDAFIQAHPQVAEAMAVAWMAVLCEATGARVHIVHVTSAWAVDLIRQARARGAPLTGETCPQYLLFDEHDLRAAGALAKVAPPMRTASDRAALWAALADGTLSMIASDHAPFLPDEKLGADALATPAGLPLGQALGPLMLSAALDGRLPLPTMVGLLTAGPARIYGVYPQKGALLPGSDADVVIYDPRPETVVDTSRWYSHSRGSARICDGMPCRGQVVHTLVRGRIVYSQGQVVGARGWGRLVRPQLQHPVHDEPDDA